MICKQRGGVDEVFREIYADRAAWTLDGIDDIALLSKT
jgi:hypothetical protein